MPPRRTENGKWDARKRATERQKKGGAKPHPIKTKLPSFSFSLERRALR